MKRFLLLAALALASPTYSQTLNFTVETTTSGGTAVVPRLTWSTAPGLASCVASALPASTEWTGPKGTQGTVLLVAITATRSYTLACTWPGQTTATVTCVAPTTHTDGSALTDLSGFRIDYGRTATTLNTAAYVTGPCTWTSPTLASGQWFFTARAVRANGLESAPYAPPVSLTLAAGGSQSRTLEVAVKLPSAPTGVTVE